MNVGIHIVNFTLPGGSAAIGPTMAEIGSAAEEAGATNLSVMDHYLQLGSWAGAADEPMLEGYTTLGYLAGTTSTAELQLMVTGVTYRHPGLLAKIVSTLDVLSRGRAVLGIGAAYQQEHDALGVPFPPLAERFERLRRHCRSSTDVERRCRPLRRQALPARRDSQFTAAAEPAAPADHDRRVRRAEDPAAGRQVR
jgi:alkanesulfonate monooxygenase SsuD/methylene tetrahydromethanopterin reductase-like flavin-dependent oxidoreductase (luciferase family)